MMVCPLSLVFLTLAAAKGGTLSSYCWVMMVGFFYLFTRLTGPQFPADAATTDTSMSPSNVF